MFIQPENTTAIEPQSFPNRVASLHDRIERADARFVTMNEVAVDVHQQVAVLLVEFLEHRIILIGVDRAAHSDPGIRRAGPQVALAGRWSSADRAEILSSSQLPRTSI